MKTISILLVGRAAASTVLSVLEKRYQVTTVTSGKAAYELVQHQAFDVVVLDAVSMRTPGERICAALRVSIGSLPLIHLHPGPQAEHGTLADAVLLPPFTPRRLYKVLERLTTVSAIPQLPLPDAPAQDLVVCGPFTLNKTRRTLVAHGQELWLTPKQAALVEVFLRHPGVVLDRRTLMEQVWQTTYLGDTRTLDVHIRWLRQAIEADPSQPRYLQTVRKVGYQLNIAEDELLPAGDRLVTESAC